jgi:hypothetical protein
LSLKIQFNYHNLLSTSNTPSGLSLYDYGFVFISHLSIHSPVSVRFLKPDARGRYQVNARGILGDQSGSSASFLQVLLIYLVGIIPQMLHVDTALMHHKNRWSIIVTIYRFVK